MSGEEEIELDVNEDIENEVPELEEVLLSTITLSNEIDDEEEP